MIAAPPVIGAFDPTPLWYRELTVRGIHEYGPVPWEGASRHPYDVLLPLLGSGALRIGDLVTHTYPLAAARAAFATALGRGDSGALKVAFAPGAPAAARMAPAHPLRPSP